MSIFVVCLITWVAIILFSMTPKQFSLVETLFVYFATMIFIICVFAVSDVNVHAVTISRSVEKSFAANISRIVTIPLLLMILANIFLTSFKRLYRWGTVFAVGLALNAYDWLLEWLDVITYRNWSVLNAFIMYCVFIVFTCLIAWWFVNLGKGGVNKA